MALGTDNSKHSSKGTDSNKSETPINVKALEERSSDNNGNESTKNNSITKSSLPGPISSKNDSKKSSKVDKSDRNRGISGPLSSADLGNKSKISSHVKSPGTSKVIPSTSSKSGGGSSKPRSSTTTEKETKLKISREISATRAPSKTKLSSSAQKTKEGDYTSSDASR